MGKKIESPEGEGTEVVDQEAGQPEAKQVEKPVTTSREQELQPGQVIIALKDKPEEEMITTLANWNTMYSKSGKWSLVAEKKS